MRRLASVAIAAIALISIGNAFWMLGGAWHWFERIPGVADTGAPNGHLIHDVGLVYSLFGCALLWVLRAPAQRHAVFVVAALFYAGHALGHVAEILVGQLPHTHWSIDLPLVFMPGLALALLAPPCIWSRVFA